jgi:putative transposase
MKVEYTKESVGFGKGVIGNIERIRDELDYQRHVDYIHYNPVKHGHSLNASDWLYSTFHEYVRKGIYDLDWASDDCANCEGIGESDV